jgi:hypothetical protein
MNMENFNYWNDPRVKAGMRSRPKTEENNGKIYILFSIENDEGKEIVHKLLCKWNVCPNCEGNGEHVNPSIDSSGLNFNDFDDDPSFKDDYISGAYNICCLQCNGKRVIPVPVLNDDAAIVKLYKQHLKDEDDWIDESASERARGA